MMQQIRLKGEFEQIREMVCEKLLKSRTGFSISEQADYQLEGKRVSIRMIQRFASTIGERTAVQLTFLEDGDEVIVNAIASGFEGLLFLHTKEGQSAALEVLRKIEEDQ